MHAWRKHGRAPAPPKPIPETESMRPVKELIQNSMDPVTLVLYGTHGCGKTCAVQYYAAQMDITDASPAHTLRLLNSLNEEGMERGTWKYTECTKDTKAILFWNGYDPARDMDIRMSRCIRRCYWFLPQFFTVVLDDFDKHIQKDVERALLFLGKLREDALHSNIFNILVICSESLTAFKLLDLCRGRRVQHAVVYWNMEESERMVDHLLQDCNMKVSEQKRQAAIAHMEATGEINKLVLSCFVGAGNPGCMLQRKVHAEVRKRADDMLEVFRSRGRRSYFE